MMSLGVDFFKLLSVEFGELLAFVAWCISSVFKSFQTFYFLPTFFFFLFGIPSSILYILEIQNVVHGSAAASPGSMLEMQNLRFHPTPTKTESEF